MSQTIKPINPIVLSGVTKTFTVGFLKKKTAVDDLSFEVPGGQIVGLLGPNGSGKSTSIKMILGFLSPDEGEVFVCGKPATDQTARNQVGYLPENPRFQRFMQGREILKYYGGLQGLRGAALSSRIDELLQLVNLSFAADERVRGYSKGMTQRLAIAQALLGSPSVLIFDEPMSGLDPLGRREIRQLIAQIHERYPSTTIFFSTHILSDVEQLCSSVILLKKGKLTRHCNIEELLTGDSERFEIIVRGLPPNLKAEWGRAHSWKETPAGLHLSLEGTPELLAYLTRLREHGATVVGLSSQRRSLEEALFSEDKPQMSKPAEVTL